MNIQHSSRTDCWYTPVYIIEYVKKVLGTIDLDPASDEFGNSRIGARFYLNCNSPREWNLDNNQMTIFLNPPGGKIGNRSLTAEFWQRLMLFNRCGYLKHAIFLAFSAEALQNTQGKGVPSIGEFPLCVPSKRIRFDTPFGVPGKAPSHSNVIVYVPGVIDETKKFTHTFRELGVVCNGVG